MMRGPAARSSATFSFLLTCFTNSTLMTSLVLLTLHHTYCDVAPPPLPPPLPHCIAPRTFKRPVRLLFEDKRSCELDGTRPGGKPDNLKVLLEHTTAIVDGLSKSLSLCPPALREVFKKLQAAVSKKWSKDKSVKYTAVSAFLFLRLVCPAVMNPKLFNMMPDHQVTSLHET